MDIAAIFLTEYAWILLWWLSCAVPGAVLLMTLEHQLDQMPAPALPLELAVFFSFAAGLVLQIGLLIVLAIFGLLFVKAVLLTFGVVLVASVCLLNSAWRDAGLPHWLARPSVAELLAVLPVFLLVGAWALVPLGPAMEHDELSYHLPYARFYLEQGGLAVNQYLRYPLHAHNFNVLFTLALMRDSLSMAHLLHASAGFATLLAVHGMARREYGSFTAFLAVFLCLGWGELTRSFGNAYADLGLMLFVVAGAFAVLEWEARRQVSWLVLAGVFAGAAMGTKYFGLIFAAMLAMWVLWSGRNIRQLLVFCGVSGVVGAFWYVRSWLISGNPVHPFMGDWFGYYIWSADNLTAQMAELKTHGVARTLVNFLRLPELFYSSKLQFHGSIRMDWLLLGIFYLAILMAWRLPRSWRPMVWLSAVFLVYWFSSAQILRYLLPVVPLMALVASATVTEILCRAGSHLSRVLPETKKIAGRVVLPLVLVMSVYYGMQHWRVDLFHVPMTAEAQHDFLSRNNTGYALFLAAAADPRIGAGPLLQFNHAGSIFYFPGEMYGDWNGPQAFLRYLEADQSRQLRVLSAERMANLLNEQGIRGVVFAFDAYGMFFPQDRADYAQHFDLVLENHFGMVMVPKAKTASK